MTTDDRAAAEAWYRKRYNVPADVTTNFDFEEFIAGVEYGQAAGMEKAAGIAERHQDCDDYYSGRSCAIPARIAQAIREGRG